MPRRQLGRRWGNQFGREPLNVYQEKERQRTVALVQTAASQAYGGELPAIPTFGAASRAAIEGVRKLASPLVGNGDAAPPPLPKESKKKKPWERIKGNIMSGDILDLGGDIAGTALAGLQVGADVTRAAVTDPFIEVQDTGTGARPTFSGGTLLRGLGRVGKDAATLGLAGANKGEMRREDAIRQKYGTQPSGFYGRLVQPANEFMQTPDLPTGVKVGVAGALDPSLAIGPGAVARVVGRGAAAGRSARILGAILENPAGVSAASIGGAAAAAQWGDKVPGLNRVPEEYRPLVGGVAGGLSPSAVARGKGFLRNLPSELAADTPIARVTREVPEGTPFYHGTDAQFEGLPRDSENGMLGRGSYWTESRKDAADYAGKGGRVIEQEAAKKLRFLERVKAVDADEVEQAIRVSGIPAEGADDVRRAFRSTDKMEGWRLANLVSDWMDGGPLNNTFRQGPTHDVTEMGWDGMTMNANGPQNYTLPRAGERGVVRDIGAPPALPEPTVKRKNIFGEVEDTGQTETELNGWRKAAEQRPVEGKQAGFGLQFEGQARGQRSIFDVLGDGPAMGVSDRRARNVGRDADFVNMKVDEVAEALGMDAAPIREAIKLKNAGQLDRPGMQALDELGRQLRQQYQERFGGRPVRVYKAGTRATRYQGIDEFADLTGRNADEVDAGSYPIEDLVTPAPHERGGSRPTADRASEDLADFAANDPEVTRRRIDTEPPPTAGQSVLESYFGSGTPGNLAARAAAGYAFGRASGEDNSEALQRSLFMALPAGVGRAALRNKGNYDNILRAVADGGGDAEVDGQRLVVKPQSVNVPHGEVKEVPELFQGRKADPGKTYSEARVRQLEAEFDPNRLEQGLLARHVGEPFVTPSGQTINTGDQVVLGGHHRLELMKRAAAKGQYAESSSWRTVDADLNNPSDLASLRKTSRLSNFGTAEPTLKERLDTFRVLQETGDTAEAVRDQMRLSDQQYNDLQYLDTLPEDIIDRIEGALPTVQEAAAEIARMGREFTLDEKDIRAALSRYAFGKKPLTRPAIRDAFEKHAAAIKEAKAAGMQGGLFEDDVDTILNAVDQVRAKEAEIRAEKRDATTLINKLGKAAYEDPALREAANRIVKDAEDRISRLEAELDSLRTGGFRPRNPVEEVPVPEANPTPPPIQQTGPDLFGDIHEPVSQEVPTGITESAAPERSAAALPRENLALGEPPEIPGRRQTLDIRGVPPGEERPIGRSYGRQGEADLELPPVEGLGAPKPEFPADTPGATRIEYPADPRFADRGTLEPAQGITGPKPELPERDFSPATRGEFPETDAGYGTQPRLSGDERPAPQARIEIDEAEARRIDEEWAKVKAGVQDPNLKRGEGAASLANKLLIEWPAAASRAAFTAATSGDLGSSLIQGAYMAWVNPKRFVTATRQSLHALVSASAREGSREYIINSLKAAVGPEHADTIMETIKRYGGSLAENASEHSSDLGSKGLESTKLGPIGAYFRGGRRQFEVATEIPRAGAWGDMFRMQRAANMANGLGDTLLPDQIADIVAVGNHLTGATKLGMNPAASIAFGAPRFLLSQLELTKDALTKGGISGKYARVAMAKSLSRIATVTVAANLAASGGKDWFGPGLGGPQDIHSVDDFKALITSSNFGRVRIGDADISLFGPLDPMARALFKELANTQELITKGEDGVFPGTATKDWLENKASPLARAILDTARGENKYTGAQYDNFGDWFLDNLDKSAPIFVQEFTDAMNGTGSYAGSAASFIGLKSSPMTASERAKEALKGVPGEFWVVDAKEQQLRPPRDVWELSAKQREDLRQRYPEIDRYLRQREEDPNKPFNQKVATTFDALQKQWDDQLTAGTMTTDAWRTQFVANQRQLSKMRDMEPRKDFEATTQRDQDLDAYFAIFNDPGVETPYGVNYDEVDRQLNGLRARVGKERWAAIKETLGWDKSPVVTQYLTDMQDYSEFLNFNPKYRDVPVEATRKTDAAVKRVREIQAANPGVPGKFILSKMQSDGDIDEETARYAQIAIGRKYSAEYEDWRATPDGERITSWFRPVRLNEDELGDVASASLGSGGSKLARSRRGGSARGNTTSRRRLTSR